MALEVIKRPSKDMPDGFESRWNGSRTPLNYKFRSNLFPVNEVDNIVSNTDMENNVTGCYLGFTSTGFQALQVSKGDYVKIDNTGTSLDGGVYKITSVFNTVSSTVNNAFNINVSFTGTFNGLGTVQKYYKGYKALVNVYVGAPTYHPYYDDGSKPEYLASQIQVDFGSDNEGVANVRQLVKPDLNSKFDDDNANSHYAWTSFFIEFAETWDNKLSGTTFIQDVLPNCVELENFENNDFSNGGDDWLTRDIGSSSIDWVFDSVQSEARTTLQYPEVSDMLYQDIPIFIGGEYRLTLDVSLDFDTSYFCRVYGIDDNETFLMGNIVFSSSGVYSIPFQTYRNSDSIGVFFGKTSSRGGTRTVTLNSISIQTVGDASPCDYSSFALFGSKQFQDPIGGNFGDYVLRPFGTNEAPKILTNFESIEFFPNKKDTFFTTIYQEFSNYVCAIIPASTFSQSEDGNNVFLEINQTDQTETVSVSYRKKVESKSDGVYVVDFKDENLTLLDSDIANKESYCQFIIIPSNMMQDGDNGTYDNEDPTTWNISAVNSIATGISSFSGNGLFNFSWPSLSIGERILYQYDTPISTFVGRDYVMESKGVSMDNFSQSLVDNASFFYRIKGTNFISDKLFFTNERPTEFDFNIKFTATQTTHQIEVVLDVFNEITQGGGAGLGVDNTTFQGPIDYISEKKPINVNTDCFGYKGVELRWIDTLGNWEYWKFKQYQDVKEKFKKTEIKSDIFTDYDDYFINGQSQYKAISVDSRKSVTVRSGLLTEDQLKNVSALQRSIEIQYKTDLGKWQTCSIKSGSFTSLEEKNNIREISFDIELVDTLTPEL